MTTDINLQNGVAMDLGEGVFVICQRDERGRPQNVLVTLEDLWTLLAVAEG